MKYLQINETTVGAQKFPLVEKIGGGKFLSENISQI